MNKRIAILLTSNDTSEFASRHPDDGEKFRRLLQPLRPDWEFVTVPVKDGVFPDDPASFDGYVVAGSPASVNDPHPWIGRLLEFIRELEGRRIPTVGACFGHQAIALALGGEVGKNPGGWSLGIEDAPFSISKPWMVPAHGTLKLYSAHKEQVTRLPAGAEVIGGNAFCPVGAMAIGDHIFTTEYHPEMTEDFMTGLVAEMDGIIDAETRERAYAQLRQPAQGGEFAKWMIAFFEMAR